MNSQPAQQPQPPTTTPPIRVVNVKHTAAFDIYIGRKMLGDSTYRPAGWGNPWRIGRDGDRATVVARFRKWILTGQDTRAILLRRRIRAGELHGKLLGCWCAPPAGLPADLNGTICHGQILAALAEDHGKLPE